MSVRSVVTVLGLVMFGAMAGAGEPYLGEPLPGEVPVLFAPGIVSDGLHNRDVAISPAGDELLFGSCVAHRCAILESHLDPSGEWSTPEVASFSGVPGTNDLEPCFSSDGQRIYYLSTRPPDGSSPDPSTTGWPHQNIWFVDRSADGWSTPQPLPPPIRSESHTFFPSMTTDGTLYFTRSGDNEPPAIFRAAQLPDGSFAEPERLVGGPNSTSGGAYNASVAPDGSWIVACVIPEGERTAVYAVSFARADGSWSDPVPLDDSLNQIGEGAISVNISPDGQYLFFAAQATDEFEDGSSMVYADIVRQLPKPRNGDSDVYWVSTSMLDRPRQLAMLGSGPYLDQAVPAEEPAPFAPGIISTGVFTRDVAMLPDGSELYFSVIVGRYAHSAIAMVRRVDGQWSAPEMAPFSGNPEHHDLEPGMAPDGSRLLFLSDRPASPGAEPNQDLWAVDREGDSWGEPYHLGPAVNTADNEFYPSLTNDGTLYFTRAAAGDPIHRIYRSRWVDGAFTEPEKLPEQVNELGRNRFNAFIAADESYLIVPMVGGEGSLGEWTTTSSTAVRTTVGASRCTCRRRSTVRRRRSGPCRSRRTAQCCSS